MGTKSLMGVLVAALVIAGAASAVERERIANEGKIGDKWMLADGAPLVVATYPAQFASRGDDVCLALGYRIQADGTTSDFAVLKQWSSAKSEDEPATGYWQAFAQAGADAVAQWRFKPRPEVTRPVVTYTVATVAFTGAPTNENHEFADRCRIEDLAGLIQQRKSRNYMDHSSAKHDLERANQASRMNSSMDENPGAMGNH